jgi:hypothetical protein
LNKILQRGELRRLDDFSESAAVPAGGATRDF